MNNRTCPADAPVVDYFDHFSPHYVTDRYDWYESIRDDVGPIFWSPNYGGFWVILGYEEVTKAARDWEIFSSRPFGYKNPDDPLLEYNGLFIPPRGARNDRPGRLPASASRLLQEDPPDWKVARTALSPLFTVEASERLRERVQKIVDAVIDRRIESGRIDLAKDVFNIIPAIVSLELAGLESSDFAKIADISNTTAHLLSDDPRWEDIIRRDEKVALNAQVAATIELRRKDRREDVISVLLNAVDNGAPYTDTDIIGMTLLLISAGIDTTAGLLGTSAMNMMQHPDLIERLKNNPEMTATAFHEFMRIGAPTQGLCRTVTTDIEFYGQKMRRGDPVMLVWSAANRDARKYECPADIQLDRQPTPVSQVGFGFGIHRCLGQNYARLEFEIIFNTILRRMPDIKIDASGAKQHENCGLVVGWMSLPATFTPGISLGIDPNIPGWDDYVVKGE